MTTHEDADAGGLLDVIAESHFKTDKEGWTVSGDGTLDYLTSGGNPGGCLRLRDHIRGISMFYQAPQQFLGNKGAVRLRWGIKWEPKEAVRVSIPPELKLIREDTVLRYEALSMQRDVWVHRNVALAAGAGWTKGTIDGPTGPAKPADFKFVLGDLQELHIRGEFMYGNEWTYLDNVVMLGKPRPSNL